MATENRAVGLRMAIVVEGGLGIVAVLLAWLFRVPLREQFPTPSAVAAPLVRGGVATLPLVAAFLWLTHTKWPTARRLRVQVQEMLDAMFRRATIVELGFVAILAGICEELLFRGVLQSLFTRWSTPLVGLAVASIVFGLLHAMSRLYFVLATLVGVYFGWLTMEYHDLVAPIVAHALYDFAAPVYLTRIERLPAEGLSRVTHETSHQQADD